MVSCDTSFLASIYLVDTHTPKARAKLRQIRPPEELMLSPFHQYELPNAVRLSVFRGLRTAAAGAMILAAFEADLASGYLACGRRTSFRCQRISHLRHQSTKASNRCRPETGPVIEQAVTACLRK